MQIENENKDARECEGNYQCIKRPKIAAELLLMQIWKGILGLCFTKYLRYFEGNKLKSFHKEELAFMPSFSLPQDIS